MTRDVDYSFPGQSNASNAYSSNGFVTRFVRFTLLIYFFWKLNEDESSIPTISSIKLKNCFGGSA